jgi:hypothetical protein
MLMRELIIIAIDTTTPATITSAAIELVETEIVTSITEDAITDAIAIAVTK